MGTPINKFLLLLCTIAFNASLIFAQITVAAAADLQYALIEISKAFAQETGIEAKTVFGSTGKLAAQIKSGAPFDVFLAANLAYPDSLFKQGLAVAAPKIYSYGIVVLWTTRGIDLTEGLRALLNPAAVKVAIPDPGHAPYGMAAVAALKRAGLYDSVKAKLVFGDNITQTAQYIATGSTDVGFNSKAIVISPQMTGKGKWVELPADSYPGIAQGAVVTKYGLDNHRKSAKKFYEFIFIKKSREILKKYGFVLPPG